ncbi:MAG: glycosyltransferase family 4 protein [Gemmatimonadota bacterium]|nr:glycosyltransferase family 4 protein [Gemmatimonadota bacterium]
MNILMHSVYFPPEVGGLESHVFHLCKGLAARGHRVDVVTSKSRPELPERENVANVHVWRTPLPARNTPGWALHALGSMPRFGTLARAAHVLHAQDIAAVLPCMVARRALGKVPFVTTYHTSHFLRRAESPFWRPVFRRFIDAADHNLAASEEIADVVRSISPGSSTEALTNGVDTELFRRTDATLRTPAAGRRRLLVPRRLFPKNGVEYLVRAMPAIVERVDVEAVLIGDGPERSRLEALAHELGVADRVVFVGSHRHDEMPGLLSSGDLAVFPSLMEATSVAALEAMACEVPVAASRVGGLPEIVDSAVGSLFEPGDPDSLARTVVDLLEGGQLRSLGRTARGRVVERWSNERLVDRHLQVYEDVIARSESRGDIRG